MVSLLSLAAVGLRESLSLSLALSLSLCLSFFGKPGKGRLAFRGYIGLELRFMGLGFEALGD